jgi:hypothetical protein
MNDILSLYRESQEQFIETELENILSGVSERNLCCRFAIILENNAKKFKLNGYYADAEYNREKNGRFKKIRDDNNQAISITSDLILHSRGNILDRDNLIAIEMKKSTRNENEKNCDRARLKAMTTANYDIIWFNNGVTHPEHVCGYELGVFIEIDNAQNRINVELFEKWEVKEKFNIKLK